MPYLSRIWLNPMRTQGQRMLRSPQVLHAAVLQGFSTGAGTEHQRVLWRLELDDPHRATLLVLSQLSPSWEHLVEQAGWPGADEPQAHTRPYEPLLDRIALGREFRFRLRANPVSSTKKPDKPSTGQKERLAASERSRGVRVPHRTAAHQFTWFTERTERWGFTIPTTAGDVPDAWIAARERVTFTKGGQTKGHRVVLETATFEGRLRITDVDAARASLLAGVGRGRAYGCGLITLAPPNSGH